MVKELFQFTNGIPQWAYSFGWAIVIVILYFFRWFWKKYGNKAFNQWTDKLQKKDKEKEELLYNLRDNEIAQDHWSLEQIIDKCMRKGYRNNEDRKDFMAIYDHYKNIGGNTDGEVLHKDFIDIPYRTELKVPESIGLNNPSKEAMEHIIEYYNLLRTGVIHEEDIKRIRQALTKKNNRRK